MTKLERAWATGSLWLWLLWPLMVIFALLSWLRRGFYHSGLIRRAKANAFVIVVGNISVGGNGKTPLVIGIVEHLTSAGLRVGILSRGYGGSQDQFPYRVNPSDPASLVGDEPRLMAARCAVPVVIDPKRARGAQYLSADLGCDVIVCDDGLQHYALQRDMEVVVMDSRRYGNGRLLPMGPLREGIWRLDTVDTIVHNVAHASEACLLGLTVPQYHMKLAATGLVNVAHPEQTLSFEALSQPVTAIAGIGNPTRFFTQLTKLGVNTAATIPFVDHHQFSASDLPSGTVVMTEKDAVKIREFAHKDCWYMPVDAVLPTDFYNEIKTRLIKSGLLKKG